MNLAVKIFSIASLSCVFVAIVVPYFTYITKVTFGKPFTCSFCMSWWVGLAYFAVTENNIFLITAYSAGCAIMSALINKHANP